MIILARVIGERAGTEFPSRPSEVKWMLQKMLFRDIAIDQVEMFVHMDPLPDLLLITLLLRHANVNDQSYPKFPGLTAECV